MHPSLRRNASAAANLNSLGANSSSSNPGFVESSFLRIHKSLSYCIYPHNRDSGKSYQEDVTVKQYIPAVTLHSMSINSDS